MSLIRQMVRSIRQTGQAKLVGDVTLTPGAGVAFTQAGQDILIAAAGGGLVKLFDQTLSVAATSIDTLANGIPAGYECLDIYVIGRTDEAVAVSSIAVQFNGDTGANYDRTSGRVVNATAASDTVLAQTSWLELLTGDSAQAGAAGVLHIRIPGYDGTTFHKTGVSSAGGSDSTAANSFVSQRTLRWRSTAAINRVKVTPGGGTNFKAGSRLVIYGRAPNPASPNGTTRGARVTKAALQTITTATTTAINFDTERYDSDGFHDTVTNNTRLTIPPGLGGKYHIGACIEWVSNATGHRLVQLVLNGTTIIAADDVSANATAGTIQDVSCDYDLAAGDYVEVQVRHTRGANLDVNATANYSPECWLHKIADAPPNVTTVQVVTNIANAAKYDGAVAHVRAGSSPFEFVELVYDATYGKWVSRPVLFAGSWGIANFTGTTGTYDDLVDTVVGEGRIYNYKALTDAGLLLQFRIGGKLVNSAANNTFLALGADEYDDDSTAATLHVFTGECELVVNGTTQTLKVSSWVTPAAWAPAKKNLRVYFQRKVSAGTGTYRALIGEFRWVSA